MRRDYGMLFCSWVHAWTEDVRPMDLQALLYEVVAELLDHHVALPRGHRLVVDADHERLASLLHSDTT
jgi:hypothetical protein